ncbi:hypothetical protein GUJ93_ZPchr0013g33958 [Zizania palustris]|uniref:Uncharacterized protein n=1 Tax=Zizania palustris TaxID=103762 RepID=A0A8J5X3U9_ZIZPA|nr:hypothetical protein GUJ93_ZPchr0013g33958 [Zizania palustris]
MLGSVDEMDESPPTPSNYDHGAYILYAASGQAYDHDRPHHKEVVPYGDHRLDVVVKAAARSPPPLPMTRSPMPAQTAPPPSHYRRALRCRRAGRRSVSAQTPALARIRQSA